VFTVTATVTDSAGTSAQTATSVLIGSVTGSWSVTYTPPNSEPSTYVDRVILNQDQAQVTGTVDHEYCGSLGAASGSVSNPRALSINASVECDGVITVSYQGTLNSTLSTWTGIVFDGNGRTGCTKAGECTFTATRTSALTSSRRQPVAR
jgi:hypothetical protein